jgi:hypothetical protein
MIKEALRESLEVAEYCIQFDKQRDSRWPGQSGCYGYPSAILLLCIVDSMGTLIEGGGDDVGKHFQILNNPEFYNLQFTGKELKLLEKEYRNKLTHNAYMRPGIMLNIGKKSDPVLCKMGRYQCLNLVPFLEVTRKSVHKVLAEC